MVIGLHIQEKKSPLLTSVQFLAERFPDHRFILFAADASVNIPNCTTVIISPKPKNKLLLFYWYNYKLSGLLKKYEIETFVSDAGILNQKIQTPQYLFFSNTNFETDKSSYFKKALQRSLAKAACIFVTEDFIAEALKKISSDQAKKIRTVYYGFDQHSGHTEITGELLKEKFTEGYDYYFYPVSASSKQHLITVLKAFSQLKKWQKSSMKLVLLPDFISDTELVPDFKNYKYRDEVKIISPAEKNADKLLQHAFAAISFSGYSSHIDVLKTMQYNVPVIMTDNAVNKSLFGEAVLYSFISDTALAETMQLIYKDEAMRANLIQHSRVILEKYDPEKTALDLLNGILVNKTVIPLKKVTP